MKNRSQWQLTRRAFLANGTLQFSAISFLPSLFGSFLKAAHAEGDSPNWLPAVIIDLAGGMALPSQFLVGGKGGPTDLLPSYGKLGWSQSEIQRRAFFEGFGLPLASEGAFLAGLNQVSSAEARARFRMGSYCHKSETDVSTNLLSAFGFISRSGAQGEAVKRGLGVRNSASGGNSNAPGLEDRFRAIQIATVDELQKLTQATGIIGDLSPSLRNSLLDRILKLSGEQARNLSQTDEGKRLSENVNRADNEVIQSLSKVVNLDARRNANAARIFGINQNTPAGNQSAIFASLVTATLTRQSGPAVLTLSGYDYHQGDAAAIAQKDREAGQVVGQVVELAHQLKQPVFIQIITDGGCSISPRHVGSRNWSSDSPVATMTINGFYDPNGAKEPVRHQVGYFTEGEGAETSTFVGNSPERVAALSFANYLALSNRLGEFSNFVSPDLVNSGLFKNPRDEAYPLFWG